MKCPRCKSTKISKNGTRNDKQNFICKQCGRQFVEHASPRGYSPEIRQICLRMRRQGMAYRKIEELTGVSHNTVIYWHKEVTDSKAPNASCCCSEMVQKPQKTMIEYSKFHE